MKQLLTIIFVSVFFHVHSQQLEQVEDKAFGSASNDEDVFCLESESGETFCLTNSWSITNNGNKTDTTYGLYDLWLYKLDENGNKVWDKSYGGTDYEYAADILLKDDFLYLIGTSSSISSGNKTAANKGEKDYWIVKTDLQGNKIWDVSFGGDTNDFVYSAVFAEDGNIIVGGSSWSGISGDKTDARFGFNDFWVVKIDTSGNMIWENTYGGTSADGLGNITVFQDRIILSGYSDSPQGFGKTAQHYGNGDYWLVEIDEQGNKLNDFSYGGNDRETISKTHELNGELILAGVSTSGVSGNKTVPTYSFYSYWILKLDSNFNIKWQKVVGGDNSGANLDLYSLTSSGNEFCIGGTIKAAPGSGTISNDSAYGNDDYYVEKIDQQGNTVWSFRAGGDDIDRLTDITHLSNGQILLSGYSYSGSTGSKTDPGFTGQSSRPDNWLVWLDIPTFIEEKNTNNSFTAYPNPAEEYIRFNIASTSALKKWRLISVTGKIESEGSVVEGINQIDLQKLSSGLYFLKLTGENQVFTKKIIVK